MSVHLLIDGYNLIFHAKGMFEGRNLKGSREKMIHFLSLYRKRKDYYVTIIFDGGIEGWDYEHQGERYGIDIEFSRIDETADEVILDIVGETGEKDSFLVVTSDNGIINVVRKIGVAFIRSEAFIERLTATLESDPLYDAYYDRDEYPESHSGKSKKKGPAKRRKRKERRRYNRIDKL